MKLKIDEHTNTLYLRLNESAILESEEVQPGVILDFDADGQLVGIELLGIKERLSSTTLRSLMLELT